MVVVEVDGSVDASAAAAVVANGRAEFLWASH